MVMRGFLRKLKRYRNMNRTEKIIADSEKIAISVVIATRKRKEANIMAKRNDKRLKALVIRPHVNPIPLHELVRMAGAKAKRLEGKRNTFFNILWSTYVPEHHVYVVLYEEEGVLSENSVLERRSKT